MTTAAAETKSSSDIISQALKIRRKTNDIEAFDEFLKVRGFDIKRQHHTHSVPRTAKANQSDSGTMDVGYPQENFDAYPALLTACDDAGIYADFAFHHTDIEEGDNFGSDPLDIITICYNSDYFGRYNGSSETGDFVCSPEHDPTCGEMSPTGIGFQYNDEEHYYSDSRISTSAGSSCTVRLNPVNTSVDPQTRSVHFDYYHLYDAISFEGWSVSFPGGVGARWDDAETQKWTNEYSIDMTQLENHCGDPDPI